MAGVNRCGVFSVVGNSEWHRYRLLILEYHGIARDEEFRREPGNFVTGLF